jgi:nitric oxide reductase subunit C
MAHKLISRYLLPVCLVCCFAVQGYGQTSEGARLVAELGCGNCHSDLPHNRNLPELIPDLSDAGSRYLPAYLFDFLQNPRQIRRHIGRSRMPDFQFSEKEALALTYFLMTRQKSAADSSLLPQTLRHWQPGAVDVSAVTKMIRDEYACLSCHQLNGSGGAIAVELQRVGARLNPRWMIAYLANPAAFGVSEQVMPAQFYQSGNLQNPLFPDAAERIKTLVTALVKMGEAERRKVQSAFESAKRAFPDVDEKKGREIFVSQGCVNCHRFADAPEAALAYRAPQLKPLAARRNPQWLKAYLAQPHAIRPFGFVPGSGSRMPDYRLTGEEVALLADYLQPGSPGAKAPAEPPLSAFQKQKARTLLAEKLACVGCHTIDGRGGKIAPPLDNVAARSDSLYIRNIINNPQMLHKDNIMPAVPMPPKWRHLIVRYLWSKKDTLAAAEKKYLSLTDYPLIIDARLSGTEKRYATMCAPCHGVSGRGDGFNAPFLRASPTQHADSAYMSTRSDDSLYEGIAAGGYILNRSHEMPPFINRLTPEEISALVSYLRSLCGCQAPLWSRDGGQP